MKDPFPIPPPDFLAPISAAIVKYTHLSALPLHLHEILIAAATYQAICYVVSPILSNAIFPRTYTSLNPRTRLNWDVHVVSMFQSLLINALGLYVLFFDDERNAWDWRQRIWGYDGALGCIAGLAVGYFLWDFCMCLWHMNTFGPGLLAHAASALAVYSFGFRPIVTYYAPIFILFELSSPFLNIHWFLDKLSLTGSTLQLVNGILLTSSFFACRLVWGTYNCFRVFPDFLQALRYQDSVEGKAWLAAAKWEGETNSVLLAAKGDALAASVAKHTVPVYLPVWIAGVYLGAYLVLMVLNVVWFGKMVSTIRARFEAPIGTKKKTTTTAAVGSKQQLKRGGEGERERDQGEKSAENVIMGRGLDGAGVKSIEVDAREVRQRGPRRKV